MEHLLNMLVGGAIAACVGLAWVPAHAENLHLSEARSVEAAAKWCEFVNEGPKQKDVLCTVGPRAVNMAVKGGERYSAGDVLAQIANVKTAMCDAIYAQLDGYHFAEGWRLNFNRPDEKLVFLSCKLDEY